MIASDFTRDNCILSNKRFSYAKLQREWVCSDCGGRLTMKRSEACQAYPQNWHIECQGCGSHDFIHELQYRTQESEALEVLDGLPPEMAEILRQGELQCH